MTIDHLLLAINQCNDGNLEFNQGNIRSFLYGSKWYPLRATVNYARALAGEESDLTTDRALVELVYLNVWTRVQDINFTNQFPVDADVQDVSAETKRLSEVLYMLTQ